MGGVPMGAMGAGRAVGDEDKEHERKFGLPIEHDEEVVGVAPSVITDSELTHIELTDSELTDSERKD